MTFGTVIVSVPSFGVDAESTIGKVLPPSVESEIFTFAALMFALVVLATSQVTVYDELPVHETLVFGEVTTKGPLEASILTTAGAVLTPPPSTRLSRTIT